MDSILNWSFNFFIPTEIVFGDGRISEIGTLAAQLGKSALIVTTPESARTKPLYAEVKARLEEAGLKVCHYDGVIPNPTTEEVAAGAALAKREKVDVVIGLGGGSSLDSAKAIAVEASHPGTAWDYLHYKTHPTKDTLPIIAVGTTAGTGSQATPCAVITKSDVKDKSAIYHRNIFPRIALVDPELTATMPPNITAQTGFDAFCHNFESYVSVRATPMVETITLDALSRIYRYLPRAVKDGADHEARTEMALADTVGGISISNAGTTLPHGLGMQIGGHCPQIAHGQALAVQYPSFTRYTRPAAVEKFAKVARIFDPSLNSVDDEAASVKCCELIDAFLKEIGLWINLKQLGATLQDIREIADCGQVLGDYKRNPRVATIEEMYELLMESYDR